ncbi:MAG TPA: saccharopine dehydrogenase NADP-binding domain-containing protein [Solirubrobacterales bacterium]|nr:saccharopine dehydrogenase NADP-binding domain-containing protein [Solirubrobacterales bacterium]
MNEASAATGRTVLFGATGYTGDLAARAMVKRGMRPVLAARRREAVEALAAELGGLDSAVADVADPSSIRALLERGDTLVTTVGPFARWGDAALDAAIDAGAHYIDSTGEPPFVRRVFEQAGPRAERSGTVAMTAMGYDWVPGNLTGALALSEAENPAGVRIGYFATGRGLGGMSGGTRASLMGVLMEPSFQFRDGSLVTERGAKKVHSFGVGDKQKQGISVGTSEAFSLPRIYPGLKDVEVYLGWFGRQSRAMQGFSLVGSGVSKVPGVRKATGAVVDRFVKTSTGGPDEEARKSGGSVFVAEALDDSGDVIATAGTQGVSGYEFTGLILAWAAEETAAGRAAQAGAGAFGPVEAFGLDRLRAGCADCGIARSDA